MAKTPLAGIEVESSLLDLQFQKVLTRESLSLSVPSSLALTFSLSEIPRGALAY